MNSIAIVPAAGSGSRFGGQKLLARIKDEPLIDWTLWSLLDGGVNQVIVVTAPGADLSESRFVRDPRVRLAVNEDPERGMFSSIQAGLALASADAILVLPADMPFVASSTVNDVRLECLGQQRIVIPVHQERRGHPIAIPGSLRRAVMLAPAHGTLKDALAAAMTRCLELPVGDEGILRDVDTVEDLGSSE